MRGYSAIGSNASATADHTLVNVIASTTVRPRIFEYKIGCSAAPADYAGHFRLGRFTAVGTAGTNPTPQALDSSDVAAIATAGAGHSAEPTYTAGATLDQVSLNQRATWRWVAAPGYELVCPATANNGIGLYLHAVGSATVFDGQINWFE